MDLIRYFEKKQIDNIDRPRLRAGDVVRVETKIQEGEKARLQTFEGTVLGVRGSGPSRTFTVRREIGKFGVERIFPLFSPLITNIEITRRQKVRRAKLNYLREVGKRRVKEDELSMQRYVKEEGDKKRLAEEAVRREEEEKIKAEAEVKKQVEAVKEQPENETQIEKDAPPKE